MEPARKRARFLSPQQDQKQQQNNNHNSNNQYGQSRNTNSHDQRNLRLNPSCYVCSPYSNRNYHKYLWLPKTPGEYSPWKHLYINQNFRGLSELVVVPVQHIGEFRDLHKYPNSSEFWAEVGMILKKLLHYGAQDLTLEISYGDWIVHKPGSVNYHAHIHVRFSNYSNTLTALDKKENVLKVPPNTKKKQIYEGDFTARIPTFQTLNFLDYCAGLSKHQAYPLFVMVSGWFKKLSGFVFRIEILSEQQTRYGLRCNVDNKAICVDLLARTPRAISHVFATNFLNKAKDSLFQHRKKKRSLHQRPQKQEKQLSGDTVSISRANNFDSKQQGTDEGEGQLKLSSPNEKDNDLSQCSEQNPDSDGSNAALFTDIIRVSGSSSSVSSSSAKTTE